MGLKGASKWTVHLVIIVMCRSVHTKTFDENMKLLGVIESKRDEVRSQHVFTLAHTSEFLRSEEGRRHKREANRSRWRG